MIIISIVKIDKYLRQFKGKILNKDILTRLGKLKEKSILHGNQKEAKTIWCLEQIYIIKEKYLFAYEKMIRKDYYLAWRELEFVEIALHSLKQHLNYNENQYNLKFIEDKIAQFQKLFPYVYFFSREATVKSWKCSICDSLFTLRNACNHEVGEIYDGEQCLKIVDEMDFHGFALVTDPFDKYAVAFPAGEKYNYEVLETLLKNLKSPYENWLLEVSEELNEEYKGLGRNDMCVCGSNQKYKKCCLKTGSNKHTHYRLSFVDKHMSEFESYSKKMVTTWMD